jgi:DNA transformation protein
MKSLPTFVDYLVNDAFFGIDGLTVKSMFGGYGMYKDGVFFAIIDQDENKLYFKFGQENAQDFENHNCKQFIYQPKNGKEMKMNYYEVPIDIIESKNELKTWVDKAYTVAVNAKKPKKTKS